MQTLPHTIGKILFCLSFVLNSTDCAFAQGGPPPELMVSVDATVAMLRATDQESMRTFVREHLATPYRHSASAQDLFERIEKIRAAVRRNADALSIEAEADGVRLVFGADRTTEVWLEIGPASHWKIAAIALAGTDEAGPARVTREQILMNHARAIEKIGMMQPSAAMASLERDHFVARLFEGSSRDAMLEDLTELKKVIAGSGLITLESRGELRVLEFRGDRNANVQFGSEDAPPFRINHFAIDFSPVDVAASVEAMSWNQLEARLDAAEEDGFSGFVTAIRKGKTVLSRGYGWADRDSGIRPTADTVFDIGSIPIDFTRIAILALAQAGMLDLNDRIGKYFDSVPADKAVISITQLFNGRSGLANFHHRDVDADHDLSFIDRDTAVRRIFEQPLLFAPGTDQSHSHSAFCLLAAIVERASGQSYADYLRKILFDPAGMKRTGFYGETLGLGRNEFAVGYGEIAATPNIPPQWGPASWLVMGSGGMVSSVADIQRGFDYLNAGKLLSGEMLREYRKANLAVGGTNRGFFLLRVRGDDDSVLYLASNTMRGPGDSAELVRSLIGLLQADGLPDQWQ